MQALLDVILPVFVIIGFGYLAVWRNLFSESDVDGVMRFTQNFAIPALLFNAIAGLDLGQSFHWPLLISFYAGALCGFIVGLLAARYIFRRSLEESVVIGFCCLFSNSLMLGLPITERAFGEDALAANYAIIALHSPFCYGIGITVMEIVRARGKSASQLAQTVFVAMFRNALVIGIALGFVVNFSGVQLPLPLQGGLDLLVSAALPAALFGLGGVMVRYRPQGDIKVIAFVCVVGLVLHPTVVWFVGRGLDLGVSDFRSAVITAAMAPGINTYVFASLYGTGRKVAASSVLFATALCIFTVWLWLGVLP